MHLLEVDVHGPNDEEGEVVDVHHDDQERHVQHALHKTCGKYLKTLLIHVIKLRYTRETLASVMTLFITPYDLNFS